MLECNVSKGRNKPHVRIELVHARVLFIHMVRKHEGLLLKQFNNQEFLNKKIEDYIDKPKYEPLLKTFFGTEMKYSLNQQVPKNKKFITELVATLRHNKNYFRCRLEILQEVLSNLPRVKIPYEIDPLPTTASPKTKLDDFINTDWWILYTTRYLSATMKHGKGERSYDITNTLARAVVRFKNFAKVEVRFYNTYTKSVDTYLGSFEIFGDDDEYLSIIVKKEVAAKNKKPIQVQMTFHIGKGAVDFAMGVFNNPQKLIEAKRGFAIKANVPYQELSAELLWKYFQVDRPPIFKAIAYYFHLQETLDDERKVDLSVNSQEEFVRQIDIPWWYDRKPTLGFLKTATYYCDRNASQDVWKELL